VSDQYAVSATVITPIPHFVQTFATTILLGNPNLPELIFASLPLDPKIDPSDIALLLLDLEEEFAESADEDEAPELRWTPIVRQPEPSSKV
jgi:hypothetical protein